MERDRLAELGVGHVMPGNLSAKTQYALADELSHFTFTELSTWDN
jgi:hypothetical protein